MNLGAPGYLLLLSLVGVVAALVAAGVWRHRVVLRRTFAPEILERVLPRPVRLRRRARDLGKLLALALLVLALAEPRFDKQIRTVSARGADIVLAVDLSRSMDARDVDPSRLERARREVADLARLVEGDRVGLVVFSGGAYLRLPLTNDLQAVQNVLAQAGTDTFQAQGSALDIAIDEAVKALTRSEGQAGKAVLVLSDGEIHDADAARAAAERADDAGVAIYAMGIGIEPSPIPLPDGTFLQDQGKVVQSVPDFSVLKEIAEITGGAFVQSVPSTRDIEGLYVGEIRKKLQAVERMSTQRETWRAAFQWPLGLALGLWLFGAWLGDGRRAFGAATTVLLAALLLPGRAQATTLEEADALFRSGKFDQAAEAFTELSLEEPGRGDLQDRLGAARYRAGDFDGAARAWDEAARLRGGDPGASFNAGNALHRAGRFDEALARYERALEREPGFEPAKKNKELTEQAIAVRRQQQPPPPPSGGGSKEQQGGGGASQDEPQEGGESGEDQEGEAGEQEGEASESEGQPGQPADPSDPSQGGSDGQTDAGDPQDRPPEGEGSQAVDPSELQEGEPSDADAQAAQGGEVGEDEGPITAMQADRLLDGVEEGSQKMYIMGRPGEKPW